MEPLDPLSLSSSLVTPSPDNLLDMDSFSLPTPDSDLLTITPQSSAAKPPKKRKSWGQPLPEPTTSLGPRKRAKTADEKEQRRIERIKRNRAAAHNSRERKRQEAAHLEIENGHLKQQMAILQAALAKCREYVPANLLPQISAEAFAAAQASFQQDVKEESLDTPESYATIDPRASLAASTPNDSTSPYIKAEAGSPSPMTVPSASTATFTSELPLDQTRHSAAMLCDLQCRSRESTLEAKAANWRWAQLTLYLMCLNITACYKSILLAFWMQWPQRMEQMMARSRSTSTPSSATTTRPTSTTLRTTTTNSTTTSTTAPTYPRLARASTLTTLSSLQTLLSLGPSRATTAHSLATCPKPVAMSAARLALLSKVMEMEKMFSSEQVSGRSSDIDNNNEDGNKLQQSQQERRSRRSTGQGFDEGGGSGVEHREEAQHQQQYWEHHGGPG